MESQVHSPLVTAQTPAEKTAFTILVMISVCHLLNDMMQTLLSAIYPLLQTNYGLSFAQIGMITLTFQGTASILQPVVGFYIDRNTLSGLVLFSQAGSYPVLLLAAALVGTGSSVFHPESSRVARMASGGRHGLAQSLFQVGGNGGSAIGPLLAALIVLRHGQASLAWFSLAALLAIYLLIKVGHWYKKHGLTRLQSRAGGPVVQTPPRGKRRAGSSPAPPPLNLSSPEWPAARPTSRNAPRNAGKRRTPSPKPPPRRGSLAA